METTSAESYRLARHVLPRSTGQSDEHFAAPTSSFCSNETYVVGLLVWNSYMHWGKSSFIVLHHKRIMSQLQSKSACKMLGSSRELRAWHMPVGMWSNFASNHDRALYICAFVCLCAALCTGFVCVCTCLCVCLFAHLRACVQHYVWVVCVGGWVGVCVCVCLCVVVYYISYF